MLPSIDSPQGDHMERTAAATAHVAPTAVTASPALMSGAPRVAVLVRRTCRVQARVSRPDARGGKQAILLAKPLLGAAGGPGPAARGSRARVTSTRPGRLLGVEERVAEERDDLRPVACRSLAEDVPAPRAG